MFAHQFFNEMNSFQREMERVLRGQVPVGRAEAVFDKVPFKVYQNAAGYVAEAELPRLDLEKLDISLLGRQLKVSGETVAPELPEGAKWVRQERRSGRFEQSFRLPQDLDSDRIAAEYKQGILKITLPKAEAAKPKKIELKVNE